MFLLFPPRKRMATRQPVAVLATALLLTSSVFIVADKPFKQFNKYVMSNVTTWFGSQTVMNIQATFTSDGCGNKTLEQFGTDVENIIVAYVMPKALSLLSVMNCVQSQTGQSVLTVVGHLVSALEDECGFSYYRAAKACNTTMERQASGTARLNATTRSQRVLLRKLNNHLVQKSLDRWCFYASTPGEPAATKSCIPTFFAWSYYTVGCPASGR